MKLEISPSGRASCRGCKQPVAKGIVRFAESYVIPGGGGDQGFRYWHLECAAKKLPAALEGALAAYDGEVPDRQTLEELVKNAPKKAKDRPLPHIDKAPTARASCLQCEQHIAKGAYRIVVERAVDTGSFVARTPGYLHPSCAAAWVNETPQESEQVLEEWVELIFKNSDASEAERSEISSLLKS